MTSGPVVDVAKISEDARLGIIKPVFQDIAVPRNVAGAVVKGAFGKVNEYKVSEAPLDTEA